METINAVWEHSYGEDCIPNFSANMEQPRHRWYEFKEGFSLTLVERAIRETKKDNKSTSFTVLDPFSGSGTSPLTALQSRCNAIGYEVNPFMSFVGKTKCQQRTKSIHDYTKELNRILVQRPFRLKSPLEGVSTFTGSGENGKWLFNLDVLRAYEALYQHISLSEYKDFFLLALITSAMQCCNAKKDGKCLRYLKNWKALNYTGANLRDTFKANALQMISDLERSPLLEGTRDITQGDTRKLLQASEHDSADLIIFSPPYLNSFDYSDIYRPELFLGKFVKDNSELMQLRKQTLRSHVQCKWDRKDSSTSPWVTGIVQKLTAKQDTLWNANIPQMVSSYFYDMEEVLKQSYRIAKQNSQLWFVVSTSAYSGVEIPVDLILADIATTHGWELDSVNTKPEEHVRKYLFSQGFRYRKNDARLPGKPDIVLPKYKTVIFVNGCFWHGHEDCHYFVWPKSNAEFWKKKIGSNIERDAKNHALLAKLGWNVIVVWECELKRSTAEEALNLLVHCIVQRQSYGNSD